MAAPSEKLAHSLSVLKGMQDTGSIAIRASELSRTHRERLLKNGFIREVMKGWYIPSRPDQAPGESTDWYASFWGFCRDYLNTRFAEQWCLSPEQSLALHIGHWTVPRQLLVRATKGGNKPTRLLHNTSIFDLRLKLPDAGDVMILEGLRIMNLPAALIACPPSYFTSQAIEIRSALSTIGDASDILRKLLDGNHSTVAGRLAGAFRNIGRNKIADTIIDTMRSAGHAVVESDPFEKQSTITFSHRELSPHVNRIRMMWEQFRQPIIDHFPASPGKITHLKAYLSQIDELYAADAYHSLSIEGYRVSAELIERVKEGSWNPDSTKEDNEYKNALAARGYWQAFQAVKTSITKVLKGNIPNGSNAGIIAEDDYSTWYRELFAPSVAAGIISAADLAGYRNRPVYIRQSMHTPPNHATERDLMPAFFELLQKEESPEVRVVLGHFIFVYIHPFIDGNGRTGRFLMNLMLAAGGYPWLVIPVEKRDIYMDALEAASVEQDIVPFARFLAGLINNQI